MAFYLVVKIFPHTGIVVIRKNVLCEKGGITKITGSVIWNILKRMIKNENGK